ncbi:AI-2E family transporter [Alienimonas chondri]|uniref:AI-2E family transporter n=1 Tax=Alienimonas chondri TaxID=2681879 RepID=A0ABX1VDH9_9PLAN|nr:AI-2E family transporter [Alienimonas chondri]NNJ25111.1 hypothetical protein [Alienimonas chondri]
MPPASRTVDASGNSEPVPVENEALDDTVPPGESPSPFVRHVWKVAAISSMVVAAFLVLCYAPEAALLVFAAVWFGASLRHGAAKLANAIGASPGIGLALVVTLLVVGLFGSLAVAGWRVSGRIDTLSQNLSTARGSVEKRLTENGMGGVVRAVPDPLKIVGGLMGGGKDGQSAQQRALTAPLTFTVYALFIFFTGLFLAISPAVYRDGLVSLFPDRQRTKLTDVLEHCGDGLWQWTKARATAMVITGVLTGLTLWALGIPMPATLGVLTALLVFIPNIGAVLAVVPPLLLAFEVGQYTPLWVLIAYVGVQLLESYVITPNVIREGTGVPPALVITAQLVFGILFGALGVLFATPLVLVAMIFITRYWINTALGHDEVDPPCEDAHEEAMQAA